VLEEEQEEEGDEDGDEQDDDEGEGEGGQKKRAIVLSAVQTRVFRSERLNGVTDLVTEGNEPPPGSYVVGGGVVSHVARLLMPVEGPMLIPATASFDFAHLKDVQARGKLMIWGGQMVLIPSVKDQRHAMKKVSAK
jgi:hypothetical protein